MSFCAKKRPFTLVEILVVIGVIGVLSGITIGTARYVSRHNQEVATKTLMKQIEIGLEAVHNRFGYYPPQSTMGDFVLPDKENDTTWAMFPKNPPAAYIKLFKRSVDMERLYQNARKVDGHYVLCGPWNENYHKYDEEKQKWEIQSKDVLQAIQYQCPGAVNKGSFDLLSGGPDGDFELDLSDSETVANRRDKVNPDNIANYELEN